MASDISEFHPSVQAFLLVGWVLDHALAPDSCMAAAVADTINAHRVCPQAVRWMVHDLEYADSVRCQFKWSIPPERRREGSRRACVQVLAPTRFRFGDGSEMYQAKTGAWLAVSP